MNKFTILFCIGITLSLSNLACSPFHESSTKGELTDSQDGNPNSEDNQNGDVLSNGNDNSNGSKSEKPFVLPDNGWQNIFKNFGEVLLHGLVKAPGNSIPATDKRALLGPNSDIDFEGDCPDGGSIKVVGEVISEPLASQRDGGPTDAITVNANITFFDCQTANFPSVDGEISAQIYSEDYKVKPKLGGASFQGSGTTDFRGDLKFTDGEKSNDCFLDVSANILDVVGTVNFKDRTATTRIKAEASGNICGVTDNFAIDQSFDLEF